MDRVLMCSTCSLDISLQCTDLCPPLCLIPLPQSPSPFAIHSENTIINTWLRTQEGSQEASLYEKRMFWVVHETGSVDTVEIFENFCSRPMNCNACVSEVDAHHLWTLLFSSQGSGNLFLLPTGVTKRELYIGSEFLSERSKEVSLDPLCSLESDFAIHDLIPNTADQLCLFSAFFPYKLMSSYLSTRKLPNIVNLNLLCSTVLGLHGSLATDPVRHAWKRFSKGSGNLLSESQGGNPWPGCRPDFEFCDDRVAGAVRFDESCSWQFRPLLPFWFSKTPCDSLRIISLSPAVKSEIRRIKEEIALGTCVWFAVKLMKFCRLSGMVAGVFNPTFQERKHVGLYESQASYTDGECGSVGGMLVYRTRQLSLIPGITKETHGFEWSRVYKAEPSGRNVEFMEEMMRFESPYVLQEDKNMRQFPGEELGYAWGKHHGCDVPGFSSSLKEWRSDFLVLLSSTVTES
ncbi:hypothetical protein U0070_025543, partial [Myodes glareolus]